MTENSEHSLGRRKIFLAAAAAVVVLAAVIFLMRRFASYDMYAVSWQKDLSQGSLTGYEPFPASQGGAPRTGSIPMR